MKKNYKPVVNFENVIGWRDHGSHGVSALLGGITNHPSLGLQREVTTSLVVGITHDPDTYKITRIETLNTTYEPIKE